VTTEQIRAYKHAYYLANREHKNALSRRWLKANRAKAAGYQRKWRATHQEAYRASKGHPMPTRPMPEMCELNCGRPAKCLDHDHATGKFRGWLCMHCNHGLGKMLDSPALLRAAATYLETTRN
jgi:hypothetical protein